jgi:hypothetical protein
MYTLMEERSPPSTRRGSIASRRNSIDEEQKKALEGSNKVDSMREAMNNAIIALNNNSEKVPSFETTEGDDIEDIKIESQKSAAEETTFIMPTPAEEKGSTRTLATTPDLDDMEVIKIELQ